MKTDSVPLTVGLLVFISSLISLRFTLPVAIIEILAGVVAGNFGLKSENWMLYLGSFGGILLTFLAGTEIDVKLMRERFKESFLIGVFSFLAPFILVFIFTFYIAHWNFSASLIAGIALSTTSLAVVYSVLVETNLSSTEIGKLIMAATFITDIGTALGLSLLFFKPTFYTAVFIVSSIIVIIFAVKFSPVVFGHPKIKNKVIEPEIKYLFIFLLALMYFANLGDSHAVLPAFVLGLLMSKYFTETSESRVVRNRLRTVAYAMITPIFFLLGGLRVSAPLIFSALGIFATLFVLKIAAKFLGVYFLAKRYIPNGTIYTTLLMSTGLTFGTIASVFGFNSGLINQSQYSVLVGVVIASAVIPTFVAQRWFMPVHSEDILDLDNGHDN